MADDLGQRKASRKEISAALERAKARSEVFVSALESFAWSASADGDFLESLARLSFEEIGEASAKDSERIAKPMLAAVGVCAQRLSQSGGSAPFRIGGILDELLARGAPGPEGPQGAPPDRADPAAWRQWASGSPWAALMKSPWGLEAAQALERGWRKGSGLAEGLRLGLDLGLARAIAAGGARRCGRELMDAMLAAASAMDSERFALALELHPNPFDMEFRGRLRDCARCFFNPDLPAIRLSQRRQIGMREERARRSDDRWPECAIDAIGAIGAKALAMGLEGLGGFEADALDEAYLSCRGSRPAAWERLAGEMAKSGAEGPRKSARRELAGRLARKALRSEDLAELEEEAFGEAIGSLAEAERWMDAKRELEPLALEIAQALPSLWGRARRDASELMDRWASDGFGRQLEWRSASGGTTQSVPWALLSLARESDWLEKATDWLGACLAQGFNPEDRASEKAKSLAERAAGSESLAKAFAIAEGKAMGGAAREGGSAGSGSSGGRRGL